MSALRTAAKRAAETFLLLAGTARRGRARLRDGTAVLAYHNVLPEGVEPAGERTLHLPLARFRAQLDLLERTHEIVSLADLERPGPGDGRPRAVVTFDDAYRGALTAGVPELARRGLPATVFVAPGILGANVLWWDRLADPETGELAPGRRAMLLDELAGSDLRITERARASGWRLTDLPPAFGIAGPEELAVAARTPGITLGAHTWSHANLTRLSAEAVRDELERPLTWLRERYEDTAVPWTAHPYGLTSPEVDRAARGAGYRGSFRVTGGPIHGPARPDDGSLPRISVPAGLSLAGFELRAAGFRSS